MFKTHPEVFMLPPNSQYNDENMPKYPIATASEPDVVNCTGVKSALNRVHMESKSRNNPKRMAFIVKNIRTALDTYCAA